MPRRPYQDMGKESRRLRLVLWPEQWQWLERAAGPKWSGLELNSYIEKVLAQHVADHLPPSLYSRPIGPSSSQSEKEEKTA